MPAYSTGDIRNILFVGHGGSGKTTLVDSLLFASGTIKHKASVADKTSVSDFEKEEKDHGHSIYSAVMHCDHLGKRINLIDTPGSAGFDRACDRVSAGGRNGCGRDQCAERGLKW